MLCVLQYRVSTVLRKKSFQFTAVATIAIFNCLIYSEIPILLKIKHQKKPNASNGTTTMRICDISNIPFFNYINVLSLIEGIITPFILLMTITLITIYLLYSARFRLRVNVDSAWRTNMATEKRRKIRDMKYAISSITLNVLFILLKIPIVLKYFVRFYSKFHFIFYLYLFTILLNLSYSMGFFVHMAANSIFRKEFFSIFYKK
jgi:hypothetical protein